MMKSKLRGATAFIALFAAILLTFGALNPAAFAATSVAESFETGNFNRLNWSTGGHGSWYVSSDYRYGGSYSAKASTSITHNQYLTIRFTPDDYPEF